MIRIWEKTFIGLMLTFIMLGCNVADQTDVNTSRSTSSTTVATETFKYNVESIEFIQNLSDVQIFPTTTYSGYYFRVLPDLPTGLRLNTSTGTISGTPTVTQAAQDYLIEAQDRDGNKEYAIIELSVIAEPPKSIKYDYATLVFNKDSYNLYSATTTGGIINYLSVTPSLPTGLSLDTNGDIYGTPLVSTSGNYIVTIENDSGSASVKIGIRIDDTAPAGLSYTNDGQTVAIGGTFNGMVASLTSSPDSTTYTVVPGLPAGLSINTSTGEITGTPTEANGISSYTVYASNNAGSSSASINISITNPATALSYPVTVISAEENVAINNIHVQSYEGGLPVTYACTTCPGGLSVNATTGTISGTPTDSYGTYSFSVEATDTATATTISTPLSLQISQDGPSSSTNLGYQNHFVLYKDQPFNFTPNISGGMPTQWSITAGNDFDDLILGMNPMNTSTGEISGTPTTAMPATTFTVTGQNYDHTSTLVDTAVQTFTIEVLVLPPTSLSYSASTEYNSTTKVYEMVDNKTIDPITPTVTGGVPDSYRVLPSLPLGLSLDTTTGIISGTPTEVTPIRYYTITAENVSGDTSKTIAISSNQLDPPTALSYNNIAGPIYTAITDEVPTYTGSSATFTINQDLPVGLTLNSATGTISGTPITGDGGAGYIITATNSAGTLDSNSFNITITNQTPSGLIYTDAAASTTIDLNDGDTVDNTVILHSDDYDEGATATIGFIATYTENGTSFFDGSNGVTLDATTGDITGTAKPTDLGELNPAYELITIDGTNNAGTSSAVFNYKVTELPPAISYLSDTSSNITSDNVIFIKGSAENTPSGALGDVIDIPATNTGGQVATRNVNGGDASSFCTATTTDTPTNDLGASYGSSVDGNATTDHTDLVTPGTTPAAAIPFHFEPTTCSFRYYQNVCFGSGESIDYTITATNSGGSSTANITVHTYDAPDFSVDDNVVIDGSKSGIGAVTNYTTTLGSCHQGSFKITPSSDFPTPFTLDSSTGVMASSQESMLARRSLVLSAEELNSGTHMNHSEAFTFQADHIEANAASAAHILEPIVYDLDGDGNQDVIVRNTACEDKNGDLSADGTCSSSARVGVYLQNSASEGNFVGATGSAFTNFSNLDPSSFNIMPYTSSKTAIVYTVGTGGSGRVYISSVNDSSNSDVALSSGFPRGIVTHNSSISSSFGVVMHNTTGVVIEQFAITSSDPNTLSATTNVTVQNYANGGISLASGRSINVVEATDMNGDGYNDIVLGYKDNTDNRARICILEGTGSSFTDTCTTRITMPPLSTGAFVLDAKFADVAGDDLEDLLVLVHDGTHNYIYVYENRYNSVAGLYQQIDTIQLVTDLRRARFDLGDINQDGYIDIVTNDVQGDIDNDGSNDGIITGHTVYYNSGSESDLYSTTNYQRNSLAHYYDTSEGHVIDVKLITIGSHLKLLHCQNDILTNNYASCGIVHQFY